jgi:hypothetical protein
MKTIFRVFVLLGFILAFSGLCSFSQVAINTDNSPADPSAGLDVKFNNKGFLPPRVALTAINSALPVTAPAIGLLIYNTTITGTPPNNVTTGYYCWDGTKWIPVLSPQGTNIGDMQYWNGTQWVGVPVGTNGQILILNNGIPTWGGIQIPVISTTSVTNINSTTATSGGNITSDGGGPVTARGVCWSTVSNPTTADSKTADGTGTGSYISNLTGLTVNILYYVRAYATNSGRTFYGNQVSFTTSYAIGQSYGGGIIFYVDGTSQHGLISATSDQSTSASWGCSTTFIPGISMAIGTGQANTTLIVNGCNEAGIAARICDDLVLNGYSDWFLPSKDELNLMYLQKTVIGGFINSTYWSSSEWFSSESDQGAWEQSFTNGSQGYTFKFYTYHVRAVRAF